MLNKKKGKRASLFDNKKGSNQEKRAILLVFRSYFIANTQLTPILTATSSVLATWTYTRGVATAILLSASLPDNKKCSKPRKTWTFISFPLKFLLTSVHSNSFWQPSQLYQPLGPKFEVLELLPSTMLQFLIAKKAQNQEKRAFLLVFLSFIFAKQCSVNSNSDSNVNCTNHLNLHVR